MRVDVTKLLFVGTKGPLDQFLEAMQALGKVQFVNKPKAVGELLGNHGYDIIRAIKILSQHNQETSNINTSHHSDTNNFYLIRNPFAFAAEVIALRDEAEKISLDLKVMTPTHLIHQKIGQIPWDDIKYIEQHSSLRLHFYEGATSKNFAHFIPELLSIGHGGEREVFVSSKELPSPLPSGLREIDRQELESLEERIISYKARLHQIEKELSKKSHLIPNLRAALIREVNIARKEEAKNQSQYEVDETLFILTGWCPGTELQRVQEEAKAHNVLVEEIALDNDEIIPTYLENKGWGEVGEDLVHIYDTPSSTDKDPSLWVLAFFSLFFAIIIGDAGYGLIFLAVGLYVQMKGIKSALGKRVAKLVALLGVSCVIWGLLCNSIFGIELSTNNPLRRHSLLTKLVTARGEYHFSQGESDSEITAWMETHDNVPPKTVDEFLYTPSSKTGSVFSDKYSDNILFEAAILIGAIHMLLGMFRYGTRNLAYFGWALFFIGGYLYFPTYLEATSLIHYTLGIPPQVGAKVGSDLMLFGGVSAMIYSIYKHGFSGIFEFMMAVQLFADALSYLRLYALGLSGALVAKMINEAAGSLPFVLGAVLLIISHAINILMSTVGGIIHGLRLNFLEWYHYSFEGGGKKFTPLRYEEKE